VRLPVTVGIVLAFAALAGCESTGRQEEAPPPTKIVGTTWLLASLYGDPPAEESEVTLIFNADGTVSGHTGVNRFSGPYRWQDNGRGMGPVSFGEIAMTKMAGPEPLMQQEARLLEALKAAQAMRAEGGLMELAAGGKPLARFRHGRAGP
jgi:heat shock protein HslJ